MSVQALSYLTEVKRIITLLLHNTDAFVQTENIYSVEILNAFEKTGGGIFLTRAHRLIALISQLALKDWKSYFVTTNDQAETVRREGWVVISNLLPFIEKQHEMCFSDGTALVSIHLLKR